MSSLESLKPIEDWSNGWTATLLVSICVFFVTSILVKIKCWKFSTLPPGPFAIPVIGNLPQLFGHDLHLILTKMGHEYGPLVWLEMGGENVLVVNNMDAAISSFVRQGKVFSGRPKKRKTVDVLLGTGKDIIMNDVGPELKFHRKLVHSFLAKQTKSNNCRLEDILMLETHSLEDKLGEYADSGQAFDPKLDISRVVANILSTCIIGRRFSDVGATFKNQLDIVQDIVDNIESFNIVDIFPFLEVKSFQNICSFTPMTILMMFNVINVNQKVCPLCI